MDNNITLQFNLTLSRENIDTLRKILLPYTSRHPEDILRHLRAQVKKDQFIKVIVI